MKISILSRYFIIVLMSISFFGCVSNPSLNNNQSNIVRYDGVYFMSYNREIFQATTAGGFSNVYLRFFEDGKVIDVNSTGNPDQIKSWFNYDNKNVGKGSYTINENRIIFTTVFEEIGFETISVEYNGYISSNGLILDSLSSNGNESKDLIFVFYKW